MRSNASHGLERPHVALYHARGNRALELHHPLEHLARAASHRKESDIRSESRENTVLSPPVRLSPPLSDKFDRFAVLHKKKNGNDLRLPYP